MKHKKVFSRSRLLTVVVLMVLAVQAQAFAADLTDQLLSESLRERLQSLVRTNEDPARIASVGAWLHSPATLTRFYQQRAFQPTWVSITGPLPIVHTLMHTIRGAERHGLNPAMYHLLALEALLSEVRREPTSLTASAIHSLGDLELLLSDAFFLYGSHVVSGRVSPEKMGEVWFANHPESDIDLAQLLQDALETDQLETVLENLHPSHSGYKGLLRARAWYQQIAEQGGWPQIPQGSTLQEGDRDPRVLTLRNRLLITSDLPHEMWREDELFDQPLTQALLGFQRRHGLEVDGIVGASTLAALNVPVEARLRQIDLSLEHWRWLPGNVGERAILVNIPAFGLEVVEQGKPVLTMRVVVGRPTRRTPLLSADITYLVLNPHWYVPPNIAIQDKLPLMRKDPGYAARQRFKIFRSGGGDTTPIDPSAINWSTVSARSFPYRLRQDPGPGNALGRVKFMFPNPFHVYLHDTPSRDLFAKAERAFSSGCIRLEKPLELAEYLLSGGPAWSREKMLAVLDTKREQTVRLPVPIPVHLFYSTAWLNAEGVVEFRKDIYERDQALERLLQDALPSPKDVNNLNVVMKR